MVTLLHTLNSPSTSGYKISLKGSIPDHNYYIYRGSTAFYEAFGLIKTESKIKSKIKSKSKMKPVRGMYF